MFCIHVDRRINTCKVQAILAKTIAQYGQPEYIRSDNGPESIAGKLQDWLESEPQIKRRYIDSGSPWHNEYIERFWTLPLQDECLERKHLWTLTEAWVVIEDWR